MSNGALARNRSSVQEASSNSVNFIDVFAGCGGLSLGLSQAGWEGVFAVEQDSFAFMTLKHNLIEGKSGAYKQWPEWLPKTEHSIKDILETYREQLESLSGKIDMIVGGPPCQGFSSAGRRDPNDPRNDLVNLYLQFVNIVEPKVVLIENVKGITHDFEDDKGANSKVNYACKIIDCLSENYTVSSRVIDTSEFGVPQRRHRFFVIAVRNDLFPSKKIHPFEQIEKNRLSFIRNKGFASLPVSSGSAISDLEVRRNGKVASRDSVGFEEISYNHPLTTYQKIMHGDVGRTNLTDTRLARHKQKIVERFQSIIKTCHTDGRLNVSLSNELKSRLGLKKSAIRVLDPERPSPTITSMPDDLIHYSEPRTLTVRENARLQSFPDWFEFQGKYTTGGERRKREVPRFTQVANAVPPLVAEAIGDTLRKILSENG
ncbi:DNA cytosine methyltransferase [Hahella sp. NBU794]|uniref:DNA cytosine methyltransferase n=1 Tax=Hahella sp. NBU794 TaxID=3422590 RepID=UPI003D6E6994